MTLKRKLYYSNGLLHLALFALTLVFYSELGLWLIAVEVGLLISVLAFHKMITKALQPLEYVEMFSSVLNEREFTARFSSLSQPDLDKLIEQFNHMLQKLHQERLAIGEQRGVFEKLMAESPIGVVLFDFENKISDVNPAAEDLLGETKDLLLNKNLKQLTNTTVKLLESVPIDSHKLVIAEQGRRFKIGHYAIYDRGFDRSFYMLYEMTSEIIESQKSAYEKLIRLMSHEVNNTIAITNSLLESCLNFKPQLDHESQDDFDKAVNIVINRCGSLNEFMQGYAEIVKLSKPLKADFNLTKLVRDLTYLFHTECEKRQIKLSLESDEEFIVKADASLIEQALMNVIKNAIEAVGNSGTVTIKIKPIEDRKVELIVEDSGCGISDDIQHQLFTPFFTSKESGQGLGLMLVREIFRLHEFDFSLRNRPDNTGAVFKLLATSN
jgi:two-component system, NtrC family, nitrogen regulation sensor histidine kinase NtrY